MDLKLQYRPIQPLPDRLAPLFAQTNFTTGPWVAGGAARRAHTGEHIKWGDIDIFCADGRQRERVIKFVGETFRGFVKDHGPSQWGTHRFSFDGMVIQVVGHKFEFPDIPRLLQTFDFTVTQFVASERLVLAPRQSYVDVARRVLRPVPGAIQVSTRSDLRLAKYLTQGFCASPDLFQSALNLDNRKVVQGRVMGEDY